MLNSKWALAPQPGGRRHVSGRAEGAVGRQEALGGDLLQRLQQVPGGQEGAGLRHLADEQQEERVSAG